MTRTRTGQCLCGAVRFTATLESLAYGACHCDMCRRWAGAPLMALDAASVAFEDESAITAHASSAEAERGFCARCGTHLYWRGAGGPYELSVGLFDDQSGLNFTHEIFTDRNPGHYGFSGERERKTEAECQGGEP